MHIVGILCYLGFAPEISILKKKGLKVDDSPHITNGLLLNLIFVMAIVFFVGVQIAVWLILMRINDFQDGFVVDFIDCVSIAPACLWIVLFSIGFLSALFGVSFSFPFSKRFLDNRVFSKFAVGFLVFAQVLAIIAAGIAFRSVKITKAASRQAAVYLLYENALYVGHDTYAVPEWIFSLGFYPIAEIANYRWGTGSASVQPLSYENLKNALKYGRLVVVASHGISGWISNGDKGYLGPADVIPLEKNKDLQFVYLAGCYSGDLRDAWEFALSPAEVKTFDRLSWIPEHVLWLWFSGPKIVAGLH